MRFSLYPVPTVANLSVYLSVVSFFLIGLTSAAGAQQPPVTPAIPMTPATTVPESAMPDVAPLDVAPLDASADALSAEASTSSDFRTDGYLLGVGDQVQVSVFNASDYSGEFSVLPGGVLNIPLAGDVLVEGLTLQQASDDIAVRISEYVRRPRVTVSLLAARPLQVAIAGEVNRPGTYTLSAEDEDSPATPTLTQAISMAGGITQSADIRQVVVQRQAPRIAQAASPDMAADNVLTTFNVSSGHDGATMAGNSSNAISVNLWQLLQEGQLAAELPLQRGDRILIPKATSLSPEESLELASASFSPDTVTVNVVGEVVSPGAISLPPNPSLNQAILSAGGFNRRARQGSVSLIRLNEDGTATQEEIDVDFEAGVNQENNPFLQPSDTVVVRTNGLNRAADTLGTVLSPLNNGFGLLRLFGL
ncbi:MAG: polysaccharide biosynthesis/export family protein [Phormidesmis sp.]